MNVVELIKQHEGLSLKVYKCPADRWTIGYGRNVEDKGISVREAEYLLANDIRQGVEHLTREYPWYVALTEVRQSALLDLYYNLGPLGISKFIRFLAAMGRSDWSGAADELRHSQWYAQVPNRSGRVVSMIETGAWP